MKLWRNLTASPALPNRTPPRSADPRDLLSKGVLSLRFRLLLTVTLFLVPIAVVSILQGLDRARVALGHVHEHLVQSVEMAASGEGNMLASGEQILRSLSNIDDVRNVTPECDRTLADALIGVRFLTNLSRVDDKGVVVCSALPGAKGLDISSLALFRAARKSMAFSVSGQIVSRVTGAPVIGAMLPLRDAGGHFGGTVGVAINALWLEHILKARSLPKDAVVSVFDRDGTIIATNNGNVARAIFSRMPRPETLRGGLESRPDSAANTWTFAAAPLVGNNIFVGFAMRESRLLGPTYLAVAADFLLPILMIALAWGGIWFATDRQVTQWIEYLRRVAAAYRGGHYRVRPSLESAPAEFRLLGDAMKDMADGIEDRDRSLREAVAQKTLQVRETHHRVKNNLQIVMSLLSLQASQSKETVVREALAEAQARINALALVHRNLNQVADQTKIDVQQLLDELTTQIAGRMSVDLSKISVTVDVIPLKVTGEIAVPLALFAVEALVNIFRHAFPPERPGGRVEVSLRRNGNGDLCLAIEDNGVGFSAENVRPGIGDRLLKVFGRQIRGTVAIDSQAGRGTRVELIFPGAAESGNARRDAAE